MFSCALSSWRLWLFLCTSPICSGNQLYPQTFYFTVLVPTLLTPYCMGTSFWLFLVRARACSSSAGMWPQWFLWAGPLCPRLVCASDITHYCAGVVWALHLSSFIFLSLYSSFLLLVSLSLCYSVMFSPSLPNNQHHTPVQQTEIQQFLIIHKSCLGVTCPNLLSWKPHRPVALSFQLFTTSVF